MTITAGIIMIRSHVSAFGKWRYQARLFSGVELLIDRVGKFPPQAADLNEIVDARTQDALHAAELLKQLAPLDRTQARYRLEYRLAVALGAPAAVSGDRKSVGLVAHSLDEVQGARIRRQQGRNDPIEREQLLLARAAVRALRDPDEPDAGDAELLEHLRRLGQLSFAPVDQQDV